MDLHTFARLPQAERDAAYNNAAAVPDSPAILRRWTEQSARVRAERPGHLDVPTGPRERNRIDLFPGARPGAPCLFFIHGGYWQRNSRDMFTCMAEGVLAHGWAAAIPGYTLAPDATLSDIVAEVRAALDLLARDGPRFGISGPIVVSGWSAGGHLTALMLDHPAVRAGLSISGVFDLAPIALTYLNEKLRLTPEEIAGLSPLTRPPVLKRLDLAYGTAELPALVRSSLLFGAYRRAAGAPGEMRPIPGADHFSIMDELSSASGQLTRSLLDLAK